MYDLQGYLTLDFERLSTIGFDVDDSRDVFTFSGVILAIRDFGGF